MLSLPSSKQAQRRIQLRVLRVPLRRLLHIELVARVGQSDRHVRHKALLVDRQTVGQVPPFDCQVDVGPVCQREILAADALLASTSATSGTVAARCSPLTVCRSTVPLRSRSSKVSPLATNSLMT